MKYAGQILKPWGLRPKQASPLQGRCVTLRHMRCSTVTAKEIIPGTIIIGTRDEGGFSNDTQEHPKYFDKQNQKWGQGAFHIEGTP